MGRRKESDAVKIAKIITMGGNWKMVLVLSIIGLVLLIVIAVWLINLLNVVIPVIAGLALVVGIGWLIWKVAMSDSSTQQASVSAPVEDRNADVVAICQSMYSNTSDIDQCIRHGGRL